MFKGIMISEEGIAQFVGAIEDWETLLRAMTEMTNRIQSIAEEKRRQRDLLNLLTPEEIEELLKSRQK